MMRPAPLLAVLAALGAVACTDFEAGPAPDAGSSDAARDPSGDGGAGEGGGKCGPTNCPGCCFNGTCFDGNTVAACGIGGAACTLCAAPQVCRPEQKCAVDPDGMWFVQPASATVAMKNGLRDWDADSSPPDAFVRLRCGFAAVQTPFVADTTMPTWTSGGCALKASDLLKGLLDLGVFDDDLTVNDVIMASAPFPVTETDLLAGQKTIASLPNLVSLRVTLKPQ